MKFRQRKKKIMKTNEVVKAPQSKLQVNGMTKVPYTREQVELIKRTVAKKATDDELKLFMLIAYKAGLDPFTRQVHFVKRKTKINGVYVEVGTTQTGIDGYLAIAERSKKLAGIEDAVYDTESAKRPNKATVTVYRMVDNVRVPFTASARWVEYVPASPMDFMWNKMPYLMLGKVALALALRKAFPNDLSGLYVNEEMEKTGDVVVDAEDVTVPKKSETQPQLTTPVIDPLQPLWDLAGKFGAKKGQEKEFVAEKLGIEIEWSKVDAKVMANYKTQLMAKCVTNGAKK